MRLSEFLAVVALAAAGMSENTKTQGLEQRFSAASGTALVSRVQYKGRSAVRVLDRLQEGRSDPLVRLPVAGFRNGRIEADVAGLPAAGAGQGARGFIGIAFRVQQDPSRYEAFYIRPTNGRADDQLRRNHATQYIGMPEYPWERLRKEQPGVYESYADMVPGEWTHLRIEVRGSNAHLYVGGADQPSLIVKDLKLGADATGGIALWVGLGTDGHFSNVRITHATE